MTRRSVVLSLLGVVLTLTGCGHSWDWKQADLDRNRLNLALFRGADSGEKLGTWVREGEVVATAGSLEGEEIAVVVRYERQIDRPYGTPKIERTCYRFTPDASGSNVDFGRTDCP